MTRGLLRHGVCGVSFLALLLVHQALNLDWYRALFRGRWNARRVLFTATDAALLIGSAALIASSLAMAGEVFPFAPFPMTFWGRGLHTATTAWSFVLVSFHLGLHGQSFWNRLRRTFGRVWPAVVLALLFAGGFAFMESGLWSDMLLLGEPKMRPAGLPAFLTQCLGVTAFFCLLARLLLGYEKYKCRRNLLFTIRDYDGTDHFFLFPPVSELLMDTGGRLFTLFQIVSEE